nr:ribonuclease H-like domain-containing protein [Tanacetum cinerariifolium]
MGFDMSKVECYNYYRKGNFARECRSPKDSRRNSATEPQRRTVPEEPANYALMAFSSSSSSSDNEYVETSIPAATSKPARPKSASSGKRRNRKTCFVCKSVDHMIKDYDYHAKKMAQPTTRNHAHRGKIGMETKMPNSRPSFSHHKCSNDLKKGNPQHALKDKGVIDSGYSRHMIGNMKGHFAKECRSPKDSRRNSATEPQRRTVPRVIVKVGPLPLFMIGSNPVMGIYAVPLPYTGTFMPPKLDLVFNTAHTAVETDHFAFTVQLSPTNTKQALSYINRPISPIIKDWVSNSEDESETKPLQIVSSFVQSSKQVKTPRHSIQYVETSIPAATSKPARPKSASSGKRRNRKTCFVCKSVDHMIKDYDYHAKKMAQPTTRNHAHMVLTQSKPVSITAIRLVNAVVPQIKVTRPRHFQPIIIKTNSPIRRHITRSPSPKTSNSPPRVTAIKALVVSAAQGMQGKWEWRPKCPILDHLSRTTSASMTLKRFDYNDALGRSKHMTENMSYLFDFEELNDGYVAFGGNPKGGKISGKGKIKTGKLDFDDVYFVKELKFNLFSVSQMCDKKNSVLFTNTECLVLSLDSKFPDESQVLLRVHRENNVYNVNLNNIVPSGDLTCLFAKATI